MALKPVDLLRELRAMKLFKKNSKEKGQTSVEYILMILVVIFVGGAMFKKVEGFLISNPDSLKNTYLGDYKDMFGGDNGGFRGQYKRFTIKR